MGVKRHHITAAEDRLPVSQKIGFGFGAVVAVIAFTSVNNLASLFFNIGLKLDPVLVGVAIALPRIWDAVTDPLIGFLSDNTRSRFGRRTPYVLVGGLLVGLLYAALWMVPRDWSQGAMFGYFMVMSLVFYTAMTVFDIPRNALGMEMANDYHERTRLFAYASFFANVAALAPPWFYWMANRNLFADEVSGLKWVGVVVGIALALCAVICASICKEPRMTEVQKQEKVKFWSSFLVTCRNRTFLWLLLIVVMVTIGFHLVGGFANYITIYYLYAGDKSAASTLLGVNGTLWAVTAIFGVFPMTWLASKIGKKFTVQLFLLLMGIGNALKVVCYNPQMPYLTLIPTLMLSAGMLVLYSLAYSMLSDVCDEDELTTGKRREGSYVSIYGWWSKVGMSLAAIISGVLLKATQFDAELVVQSRETLYWIRAWEIGLPALLCFAGAVLLTKYPLTEARAYEVKDLLAKRRDGISETNGKKA